RSKREELRREHTLEARRQGPSPCGHDRVEARDYRAVGPPKGGGGDLHSGVLSLLRLPQADEGVNVQRLFSTFPNGWPGIGLLLQRVLTATALFSSGLGHVREAAQFGSSVPQWAAAGAGILLLLGLWTPFCGTLIALVEAWVAYSSADPGIPI